jgi:hypothetical protein
MNKLQLLQDYAKVNDIYIISKDIEEYIAYFIIKEYSKGKESVKYVELYLEIKDNSTKDFELTSLYTVVDVSTQSFTFGEFLYYNLKIDMSTFDYIENDDIVGSINDSFIQ